ncbi:MAG: hypothetical protein ACYS80_11290 [Planctomycetota bacterium]|jgi:photosystem II stability/assembly factor-like uncharacterized protein
MSVCKTTNAGTSWGTRHNLGSGAGYPSICWDIAVAPGDPEIVYAGGLEGGYVKVYRSPDAGNSWVDISENLPSFHSINNIVYAIWISPYDPDKVLLGTSHGVFTSTFKGVEQIRNWSPTSLEYSTRAFSYYQSKETVYAATESQGVYSTADGGSSWQDLNDGLDCLETLCIDLDSENGFLFVGTDGGAVWRLGIVDLNNDNEVDFNDFIILAGNWMDTCDSGDWCQGSDLNSSGRVDFRDLLNLAGHWLR